MGRFEPKHDPAVLIAIAREVLLAANPEHPEAVTQRAYDAARAAVGHAATPRADQLVSRFGVGWATLRDRILNHPDPAYALAVHSKQQVRRVLTRAESVAAIRRAAAWLGTTELSYAQYEQARQAIDAQAARRHGHGRHLVPLPTADLIRHKASFPELVAEAGLTVPGALRHAALPRADAVVVFLEHYGFVPTQLELDWFGRHHGIQLVHRFHRDLPQSVVVGLARERMQALGRWFPDRVPLRLARPDGWEQLADGAPALVALARQYPRQRAPGQGYTLEELRESIARAFDALPPGERLTAERYRAMSRAHGLPSMKTVAKVGKANGTSFSGLVRDEAARRAAAKRAR